jgi:2-amino-4-hydroxy-6-hydroxymethyldihydropteridine diphosphokinase
VDLKTYHIGAGTNLGDKVVNMEKAMAFLNTAPLAIKALSTLHAFKSWGYDSQNDFLNACFVIETELTAFELLHHLKNFEKEMGREPKTGEGYSDRILDLDILFCGTLELNTEKLKIPHPDLHRRAFVLEPLCEIDENFMHPLLKKTVRELLDEIS